MFCIQSIGVLHSNHICFGKVFLGFHKNISFLCYLYNILTDIPVLLNYITMDNRFLDLIEKHKGALGPPRLLRLQWTYLPFQRRRTADRKVSHPTGTCRYQERRQSGHRRTQLLQLGNLLFRNIGLRGCCRADPARVQTRQYPSHRQPFGSKSRTGRLQQLGEHERKDDAGCQAIHDAGQLLHYRLQK